MSIFTGDTTDIVSRKGAVLRDVLKDIKKRFGIVADELGLGATRIRPILGLPGRGGEGF